MQWHCKFLSNKAACCCIPRGATFCPGWNGCAAIKVTPRVAKSRNRCICNKVVPGQRRNAPVRTEGITAATFHKRGTRQPWFSSSCLKLLWQGRMHMDALVSRCEPRLTYRTAIDLGSTDMHSKHAPNELNNNTNRLSHKVRETG